MIKLLGILTVLTAVLSGCAVYTPSGAVMVDPKASAPEVGATSALPVRPRKAIAESSSAHIKKPADAGFLFGK